MLRQMVVRLRKQTGMSVKELAKVSGAHQTTIKGWLARARTEGEKGLEEKRRGRPVGACRKLTLAAEAWIRDQIIQGNPQQIKLPFALWTRPAIRALIRDRFGVDLQERLVGKYLKRWGFTPQRPVKRALEQDYPRLRASGPRGSGDLLGGRDGRQGRCPLGGRVCSSGTNAGIDCSRPMDHAIHDLGDFSAGQSRFPDCRRQHGCGAFHRFSHGLDSECAQENLSGSR